MKVLVIAATWVWSAMVGAAGNPNTCPVSRQDGFGRALRYTVVNFTTVGATRESYSEFLQAIRGHLTSGNLSHEIPVMRNRSTVPDPERFLLVELSNWQGLSITLAMDVTNAYLVAYRASDRSYFFHDAPRPASSNLFPGTERHNFSFDSNYINLERRGVHRMAIDLGMSAFDEAITTFYYWRSRINTEDTLARSFLVFIQMIPEAARFRYIEQSVGRSIVDRSTSLPNQAMLSLENNWGALSSAIQQSNHGVFNNTTVQLRRPDGTFFNVDSVTRSLISNLGILVFARRNARSSRFRSSIDADYDNNICPETEPTIRISGRNGLCADVKYGAYDDGNPIQLWQYCDKAVEMDANVLWEVHEDGSIIDPRSKLALSTYSGNTGSNLTMATNKYASSQGWLASNNRTPFVTFIVGFKDLCLVQGNRKALWLVWLAECDSDRIEQQWALYADGSIRPQQDQNMCISCNTYNQQGSIVFIFYCTGSSQQRWMFKNDGTILNLFNGLVMDVKRSDPNLEEIIIWPSTGNLNQKWLPLPFDT
ncbi:unnamed protein product [Dovyalis caffra]|uniref:Ribosome-inactivating protein n=1 Tax=Dovyalis caffra TaxID=77055 RepID=A0AAV1SVT8_9ROSI|nr:unnamed protein product [Dovyalis caffra]